MINHSRIRGSKGDVLSVFGTSQPRWHIPVINFGLGMKFTCSERPRTFCKQPRPGPVRRMWMQTGYSPGMQSDSMFDAYKIQIQRSRFKSDKSCRAFLTALTASGA